jgi:SAM-dependent methyltransferase
MVLVVCQQMLQFVPDRAAALREMRRVLAPGGRLVLATWRAREEQPLFEVLGRIAERHLGVPNEKRFLLGDDVALGAMVAEAGFEDVHVLWEGTNHKTGGGNGVFRRKERGDMDEAWISIVVGRKRG